MPVPAGAKLGPSWGRGAGSSRRGCGARSCRSAARRSELVLDFRDMVESLEEGTLERNEDLFEPTLGKKVRVYTFFGRETVFADDTDAVIGDLAGMRPSDIADDARAGAAARRTAGRTPCTLPVTPWSMRVVMRELQFDGLVGPTHNYGGLSPATSRARARGPGVEPARAPRDRGSRRCASCAASASRRRCCRRTIARASPSLRAPRLPGSDEEVIAAAAARGRLLPAPRARARRPCGPRTPPPSPPRATPPTAACTSRRRTSSRCSTAPSRRRRRRASCAPSSPTQRASSCTTRCPAAVSSPTRAPPNHTRLATSRGAAHLFAWGRRAWGAFAGPRRYPARQTREASQALARLHRLDPARCLFPQQHPDGIDAGAFHTDVIAVGNGALLHAPRARLRRRRAPRRTTCGALLGDELFVVRASSGELPPESAVAAYPFNSQVLALPDGTMAIVAPEDSREDAACARLPRAASSRAAAPVRAVHYIDVRQSMHNGGGPACLRLRVPLDATRSGRSARASCSTTRSHRRSAPGSTATTATVSSRHDLGDPALARECMAALDELTRSCAWVPSTTSSATDRPWAGPCYKA